MKDNQEQSSNLGPSSLLQNFTKNVFQSQYIAPTQPYRSVSKLQSNKYNNNQFFSIQNRQLLSQTSRKKLQLPQAQLQQRYQQIQKILISQNYNLKQQNQYLAGQIRRAAKREKQLRNQLQEITYRSNERQESIIKLEQDFSQLKDYLQQNIQTLILLLQVDSLGQIKNGLCSFIEGISHRLCLENTQRIKLEVRQNENFGQSDLQSIDKEVQELSVRLQSLIQENNSSCREPTVRRECIQIAKQIKQLQNKKKISRFSKQRDEIASFDRAKSSFVKHTGKNVSSRQLKSHLSLKQQSVIKKQLSDDKFKYPQQIYSKLTHRISGNKETKLLHSNSVSSMVNKEKEKY